MLASQVRSRAACPPAAQVGAGVVVPEFGAMAGWLAQVSVDSDHVAAGPRTWTGVAGQATAAVRVKVALVTQ